MPVITQKIKDFSNSYIAQGAKENCQNVWDNRIFKKALKFGPKMIVPTMGAMGGLEAFMVKSSGLALLSEQSFVGFSAIVGGLAGASIGLVAIGVTACGIGLYNTIKAKGIKKTVGALLSTLAITSAALSLPALTFPPLNKIINKNTATRNLFIEQTKDECLRRNVISNKSTEAEGFTLPAQCELKDHFQSKCVGASNISIVIDDDAKKIKSITCTHSTPSNQ